MPETVPEQETAGHAADWTPPSVASGTVDPDLVTALRDLGGTYGPRGVASAAAELAMPARDAELGRLRNRITALEANGSELLARAERAEAERDRLQMRFDADQDELEALRSEIQALNAELALHVGCRVDISIGDALKLIRAPESNADAPSPVTAATEAHGETTEAEEG